MLRFRDGECAVAPVGTTRARAGKRRASPAIRPKSRRAARGTSIVEQPLQRAAQRCARFRRVGQAAMDARRAAQTSSLRAGGVEIGARRVVRTREPPRRLPGERPSGSSPGRRQRRLRTGTRTAERKRRGAHDSPAAAGRSRIRGCAGIGAEADLGSWRCDAGPAFHFQHAADRRDYPEERVLNAISTSWLGTRVSSELRPRSHNSRAKASST